jgi:hypothetical protein
MPLGRRAKPEFLKLWEEHEKDKHFIPAGEMITHGHKWEGVRRLTLDAANDPDPFHSKCPTEEEMINIGLLMLAFPDRVSASEAFLYDDYLKTEHPISHVTLYAIAPFVRRLLAKRGVDWKQFVDDDTKRRNKRLIKAYRKKGIIP